MKLGNTQYKKYMLKHQKFQIFVGPGGEGERRGERGGVRAGKGKGRGEACFIWARGLCHGP